MRLITSSHIVVIVFHFWLSRLVKAVENPVQQVMVLLPWVRMFSHKLFVLFYIFTYYLFLFRVWQGTWSLIDSGRTYSINHTTLTCGCVLIKKIPYINMSFNLGWVDIYVLQFWMCTIRQLNLCKIKQVNTRILRDIIHIRCHGGHKLAT